MPESLNSVTNSDVADIDSVEVQIEIYFFAVGIAFFLVHLLRNMLLCNLFRSSTPPVSATSEFLTEFRDSALIPEDCGPITEVTPPLLQKQGSSIGAVKARSTKGELKARETAIAESGI